MRFKLIITLLLLHFFSFAQQKAVDSLHAFGFKFFSSTTIEPQKVDTFTGNWIIKDNSNDTEYILFTPAIETIAYDTLRKSLTFQAILPVFTIKKAYELQKTALISIPCFLTPTKKELIQLSKTLKIISEKHAFKRNTSIHDAKETIISDAIFQLCDSLKLSESNARFILDNGALFNDSCSYMKACKKGLENYIKMYPVYNGKPQNFRRLFQNQDKLLQQQTFEAFILKALTNWESDLSPKQQHRFRKKLTKKRGVSPKKCTCSACTALTNRN